MAESQVQAPIPVVVQEPPPGLSIEERMARHLNPEAFKPRDEQGRFATQAPKPEAQQPQAQQQPQQAQAEEPPPPADSEVPETPVWDEVKEVKLKVPMKDGSREWEDEVTLEQLRNERMLHSDYTRKTQEIAEQRRTLETQAQQAVLRERQQYMQALQQMQQSVIASAAPELNNVDWDKLATEDPAQYVRLSNRAKQVNETLASIHAEQEKVQQQMQAQRQERLTQRVAEAKEKIVKDIPEWNDDLYKELMDRGVKSYGFTPQEVSNAFDPRFIRMLHDLNQFHKMKEQKPLVEKKVQSLPPVLKPGLAKQSTNRGVERLKAARERLKADPNSIDAAADAFGVMFRTEK